MRVCVTRLDQMQAFGDAAATRVCVRTTGRVYVCTLDLMDDCSQQKAVQNKIHVHVAFYTTEDLFISLAP